MCSDAREPKPSARCRQLLCSEGECSVSAQEEARIVKNISKHFQRNKEMQHVEDAAVSLCWHLRRLGWGWPGARSADGLPTSHWFCGNPGMGGAVGRSPASGLKGGPSFQQLPVPAQGPRGAHVAARAPSMHSAHTAFKGKVAAVPSRVDAWGQAACSKQAEGREWLLAVSCRLEPGEGPELRSQHLWQRPWVLLTCRLGRNNSSLRVPPHVASSS